MSTRGNLFNKVGAIRPRRTAFDLSYRNNFTCDMGQLIPVFLQEAVPGDHFKIGAELLIRFQPLISPVMHEITATIHYFFIPNRLLSDEDFSISGNVNRWEKFISNDFGATGDVSHPPMPLPRWFDTYSGTEQQLASIAPNTLWDYFGFPILPVGFSGATVYLNALIDSNSTPLAFPRSAYNLIYNEYYRDQDIQPDKVPWSNYRILNRNWRKDYFTAARPFQQKGLAPALPVHTDYDYTLLPPPVASNIVSGVTPGYFGAKVGFYDASSANVNPFGFDTLSSLYAQIVPGSSANTQSSIYSLNAPSPGNPIVNTNFTPNNGDSSLFGLGYRRNASGASGYGPLMVRVNDLLEGIKRASSLTSTTFNVSDLRLAFQTQKWLERNARAGTRYTEFLKAHFDVSPSDSRLDRPEYIGGIKQPVIISEVLQTSNTTDSPNGEVSPQANMAGHGLSADSQFAGSYNVQEFGIIMGILSIMPKPSYQGGIPREWQRRLPTDFYFPEFAHLSEQAIKYSEIYACYPMAEQYDGIFGYTGQYDEMRVNHDIVSADMRVAVRDPNGVPLRPDLSFWNLTRSWSRNSPPSLNSEFITCVPDKRIFAVQEMPDPQNPSRMIPVHGLMCNVLNSVLAVRPLPEIAEPGLVDHF